MKKAKIFLTGLAVLAVVGGALAFKAKHQFKYASICDPTVIPHVCTINPFLSFATTLNGIWDANFDSFGAPCPNGVCKTKTVISD
jgi:hypothetical protein